MFLSSYWQKSCNLSQHTSDTQSTHFLTILFIYCLDQSILCRYYTNTYGNQCFVNVYKLYRSILMKIINNKISIFLNNRWKAKHNLLNRNVNYNLWNGGYVIPSVYNQSVKQRLHYSFCLQSIYETGYVIPYAYNQSVKERLCYSFCLQLICETAATLFLMFTINLWNRLRYSLFLQSICETG